LIRKHPFRKRIDRYVRDTVLLDVLPKLSDRGLVLDLGCGDAPYAGFFRNFQYVAVDLNKRSKAVVLCDATSLPFKSETFDLVLASELLEHVSEPSLVLKEAYRVLKFNGHIIVTTRFMFPYHPEPSDYYSSRRRPLLSYWRKPVSRSWAWKRKEDCYF